MKFGRFHVFILFLFVPSQEAFASVNQKITLTQPTVILISFDGFRWDYLDKVPTPNFDSIVRNGVKAKHIINTFVTKTFPNHYTIVTGLYEESHGILGNNMYDPVFNETFHIGSPSFLDIKWWNGEPVWITNQKAFKKSAVVFWPGSEVKGQTPTHFLKYNNKLPFKKRVQYLLDQLEGNDPPSFLAAYFNEPDHTGHQVGPNSPELHKVIRRVDNVTGYLLKSLQNRGLLDQVNLIITSDHGMAELNSSRIIELDKFLPSDWYTLVAWPGKSVRPKDVYFHVLPKDGMLDKTYKKLKVIPHLNVYLKKEIPEEFHYKHNRRVMPIFIVADDQWIITRSISEINTHGNHGYSNKYSDMHPFFLAQGPAFKSNFISEPFENVHIYPLMCHILGIEPSSNNGSLLAVKQLLKITPQEVKQDVTALIVLSVISFVVFLLMSYGIVSFCVKNHCRMRQYGHIYDLGISDFDL
ncbi:hypothetical protein pdam_00010202 [Pocillopora damicornis]|uniref:AP3A hydrolase n=1 Tax=Pocillopora damicornis TaxID=46731 RepID=A0A3M6T468_POCDA|nr:ectonucleotide pyrophosphatase/phosphodiesterase family member 5-like [Pocillopora damicornis]RMX34747.1 hypothetical protein pdam_00010202 [Pocillopora damicornis]